MIVVGVVSIIAVPKVFAQGFLAGTLAGPNSVIEPQKIFLVS